MKSMSGVEYEFYSRCLTCGADETDTPGVTVTEKTVTDPNPRRTLTEQTKRTYHCNACDTTSHQKGPVETGKLFTVARVPTNKPKMPIRIGGTEIQYREAEAFVLETELFDQTGLTNNGRNRTVRIWAFDPPTFTKENAYRVELGSYLDERMLLLGINYYSADDPWRRLSFHRGLDSGILDMVEGLQNED